jgi:dihydrofolate reductase
MINLIVAVSRTGAIGKDNQLLWHLPKDLKRFKEVTTGHTVVMGRKTYESIGKPLPNRENIVITRTPSSINLLGVKGLKAINNIHTVLEMARKQEIFIIGGAEIYNQFIPYADKIFITYVSAYVDGDTHFPDFNVGDYDITQYEVVPKDDRNLYDMVFAIYENKKLG